eukprot:6478711-Amphidinium_carterae.1
MGLSSSQSSKHNATFHELLRKNVIKWRVFLYLSRILDTSVFAAASDCLGGASDDDAAAPDGNCSSSGCGSMPPSRKD